MKNTNIQAISLFSGAGGLDIGAKHTFPKDYKLNGKSFYIPTYLDIKIKDQEYIVEIISKQIKLL